MDYLSVIILLIIIAIGPWLVYFIYYSKLHSEFVKIFIMGGVGWYAALMLRLPIILVMSFYFDMLTIGIISAICAGIFEETIRYFFAKQFIEKEIINGKVMSLGVGWGLGEAFLVFALNMIVIAIIVTNKIEIPTLQIPSPEDLFIMGLIGAVERIVATMLHVTLTLFVVRSLKNKKFLYYAIIYHTIVDIFAALYHANILDIALLEIIFLFLTIAGLIIARIYIKQDIWKFFKDPNANF
ncbi:MAG: YhfC family glutamic-type intramembrane protease [Candidatus Njordarchaeota archaeon]